MRCLQVASSPRLSGAEQQVLGVLTRRVINRLWVLPGRSLLLALPTTASTPATNRVPPEPADQFPAWSRCWMLKAVRECCHRDVALGTG
jgi:hypothetical protein